MHSWSTTAAFAAILIGGSGCGGTASNAKPPEKPLTNQEVSSSIDESLKVALDEVDKDPKLTPKQKEETKAMMRKTVEERSKGYRE
jgi:carbonic anhydrase